MTDSYPHLERAPITEAIVDLGVEAPGLTLERVACVHDGLRDAFPEKRDHVEYEFALDVNAVAPRKTERHLGWLAWSADRSRAMQARLDGFTFSRLPQYRDWSELRDDARRAWTVYVGTVTPRSVNRLAVRYINRIELPQPIKSFDHYFHTFPRIGPTLPQVLSDLFVRMLIPFDAATASITYAIDVSGVTPSILPIVMDVGVFMHAQLDPQSDDVWLALDKLRDIKNKVFFGSVTEQLREMFQ